MTPDVDHTMMLAGCYPGNLTVVVSGPTRRTLSPPNTVSVLGWRSPSIYACWLKDEGQTGSLTRTASNLRTSRLQGTLVKDRKE